MEKYEINKYISEFSNNISDIKSSLNVSLLEEQINDLSSKMDDQNFWLDQKKANQVIKELNQKKEKLDIYLEAQKGLDDILDLKEIAELENTEEANQFLEDSILSFKKRIEELLIMVILSGPYDNHDCILEIHPGAGGTESMDWANMLLRMYKRFAEKNNFKFKIVDFLPGDEAGLKSVTVSVSGKNAYGMLKGEAGVHRLVRISPFDANKRRHTSFASVDITPEVSEVDDVIINDEDIRVDTYLSSGHGGQGVNTTYSAVRITYLPLNIVVTCQNERSQIQNKEQALKVLKSKLLNIKIKEQEDEVKALKGEMGQIAFGSQIRSYVFHPYSMVKDHRYGYETGNANAVMDGDLLDLIYGYLKWSVTNES